MGLFRSKAAGDAAAKVVVAAAKPAAKFTSRAVGYATTAVIGFASGFLGGVVARKLRPSPRVTIDDAAAARIAAAIARQNGQQGHKPVPTHAI